MAPLLISRTSLRSIPILTRHRTIHTHSDLESNGPQFPRYEINPTKHGREISQILNSQCTRTLGTRKDSCGWYHNLVQKLLKNGFDKILSPKIVAQVVSVQRNPNIALLILSVNVHMQFHPSSEKCLGPASNARGKISMAPKFNKTGIQI
jgi:hypothetical protein